MPKVSSKKQKNIEVDHSAPTTSKLSDKTRSTVVKSADSSLYLSPTSKNMANKRANVEVITRRIMPDRRAKSKANPVVEISPVVTNKVSALKKSFIPTPTKRSAEISFRKILGDMSLLSSTPSKIPKSKEILPAVQGKSRVKTVKKTPEKVKSKGKTTQKPKALKVSELQNASLNSSIPVLKPTTSKSLPISNPEKKSQNLADEPATIKPTRSGRGRTKLAGLPAASKENELKPTRSRSKTVVIEKRVENPVEDIEKVKSTRSAGGRSKLKSASSEIVKTEIVKEKKVIAANSETQIELKKPVGGRRRKAEIKVDFTNEPTTSSQRDEVSPNKQLKLTSEQSKKKTEKPKKSPKIAEKKKQAVKTVASDQPKKVVRKNVPLPTFDDFENGLEVPKIATPKIFHTPIRKIPSSEADDKKKPEQKEENRRHSKVWHSPTRESPSSSSASGSLSKVEEKSEKIIEATKNPQSPPIASFYAKEVAKNFDLYKNDHCPLPPAHYKFESIGNLIAASSEFSKRRYPTVEQNFSTLNDSNAENNDPIVNKRSRIDQAKIAGRSPLKSLPLPDIPDHEVSSISVFNVTIDKSIQVKEVEVLVSIKPHLDSMATSTPIPIKNLKGRKKHLKQATANDNVTKRRRNLK